MPLVVKGMSSQESRAWLSLMSLSQMLEAALDRQLLEDAGLINFEYGILTALQLAQDQKMRSGDLAVAMGSPAPRMSKAVARLERRGLVERVSCPSDGRAINVGLTEDGSQLWRKASKPHVTFARDTILGELSEEALTQLADLLQPIVTKLDPSGSFGRAFG